MSSLCRVCLVGNVKMYPIESNNIQKVYENVTNTKLSTVQGPRTVCYLCHSLLHKYGKFTEQARNSENILKDLFNKGIEATYENIAKTSHILQINFSTTCVETVDLKDMRNSTKSYDEDAISSKDNINTPFEAVMLFNEEIDGNNDQNAEEINFQSHDRYIEIPPIHPESLKQEFGLGICCDTCGEMLINKDDLVIHIWTYHKSDFTETEEQNALAPKSKDRYLRCYDDFIQWQSKNRFDSFSEHVLMTYFKELAKTYKPSTLWSTYSMLKMTLSMKNNVNMKDFAELLKFLKTQSDGYKTEKSKVFTAAEVQLFLNEAPDEKYLAMKVVMIMAIGGGCRSTELVKMTVHDIEKQGELIVAKIRGTQKKNDRTFMVKKELVGIIEKYQRLRPKDLKTDRFFLNYQKGKCCMSVIGKNKMAALPKAIATYLKLPNPHLYSGRCFRRTSAIL